MSGQDYQMYLDRIGIALTLLRPAGTIDIDGVHLDVVSEGKYIAAGTMVKVVRVNGQSIIVRPVNDG